MTKRIPSESTAQATVKKESETTQSAPPAASAFGNSSATEPARMPREQWAVHFKLAIWISAIAVVALGLSLPAFVRGPLLSAHDTREHIHYGEHFAEQFWRGEFYPRWLLNMNHGLGSPSLFVYPPLPSYVYTLLLPVTSFLHLDAYVVGGYLCLFTSGLCAFLWVRTIANQRVSFIVAALYMLLPYHLAIDFYRRGALAECWALAWMPLVLYFTTRVVKKKRGALAGLAVAFALLIVSHLISVLIFCTVPILLALMMAERGKRARAVLSVVGGFALGTAVSAGYLLPALVSAKYFPVSRLGYLTDTSIRLNLLWFGKRLLTGPAVFIHAVSLATVDTALFIAFSGFMSLRTGPRCRQPQTLAWLAICVVSLFLMSSRSFRLWKALPPVTGAVQFPWRLDILLCIAVLPLSAFLLSDLCGKERFRVSIAAIVMLFAATWFGGYIACLRRYSIPPHYNGPVIDSDGWFWAWEPPGTDQASAFQASLGPRARLIAGGGTVVVLSWKPRKIEVQTDCTTSGTLMINQFYYPKWEAQLVRDGTALHVWPAFPQGLLEVQVPPGHQQVLLEIPRQATEQVGNWTSALGLFACIAILASSLVRARPQPQLAAARHEASETTKK